MIIDPMITDCALAATRELIQNDLVRTIVAEIDRAIAGTETKDARAVFEAVDDTAFGWYPRSALYLTAYVRLVDMGYATSFDLHYFISLPGMPEGLAEALRESGSARKH